MDCIKFVKCDLLPHEKSLVASLPSSSELLPCPHRTVLSCPTLPDSPELPLPAPRPAYRWMPEHWMHRVMPRLMLAQRGSAVPQSQQWLLPAMMRTFCRAPSPFRFLSRGSPLESRLPVDAEDLLSSFCADKAPWGSGEQGGHKGNGVKYGCGAPASSPPHRPPSPGMLWQCCSARL